VKTYPRPMWTSWDYHYFTYLNSGYLIYQSRGVDSFTKTLTYEIDLVSISFGFSIILDNVMLVEHHHDRFLCPGTCDLILGFRRSYNLAFALGLAQEGHC